MTNAERAYCRGPALNDYLMSRSSGGGSRRHKWDAVPAVLIQQYIAFLERTLQLPFQI